MIKAPNAEAAPPSPAGHPHPALPDSRPVSAGGGAGWTAIAHWARRPLVWRDRRRLAGHAEELRGYAAALAGHAAATEPEFLALGGELRHLYEQSTDLTKAVDEATGRLHSCLTANRIEGADGGVARTLRAVEGSIAAIDDMLGRLRTMTAGLVGMKPHIDQIGRVGVLLHSVAIGFAVESSRTTECQQTFGSFVDEIHGLSRRTREVEARITAELDRATAEENAALQSLEQELSSLRELSRALELTSSRTAAEIQSRLDDSVSAMAAMRECSLLIQRHTEDAVFHMQFGDIVRQKIEHTVETLQETAGALQTRGRPPFHAAAAAHLALAVLSAQLALTEEELATARGQLTQAFSRIAESSATLLAPGRQRGPAAPDGAIGLGPLITDLEQLHQLAAHGEQLRQRADESGRQAFATAERITAQIGEVQSINREMHLLALNAIVKTAALGAAGATLEVLSMQVHTLYVAADTAVDSIGTLARQLTDAQTHAESRAGAAAPAGLSEVVQQVRAAAEEYTTSTQALATRADDSRGQLERARARLESLDRFARELRDLREHLDTAGAALAKHFGPALAQAQQPTASLGETRYTMQSERDIHHRIGGTPVAAVAPDTPARAATPTEPGRETAKAEPGPSDTSAASTPTAAEPQPLGDNVELF